MSGIDEQTLRQLRSPRVAAINGILFSLLSITVMFGSFHSPTILKEDPKLADHEGNLVES